MFTRKKSVSKDHRQINFPRVSIIVLNWNGRQFLKQCLDSLVKINYPKLEVIVVDNASVDGSQEIVKKYFAQVKLIENKNNLGYPEGNNVGIISASGDLLVLLNNDAFVHKDWINELVRVALSDGKIGVLGCKVYFRGTKIIQHAGGIIDTTASVLPHIGVLQQDRGQFNKIRDVDYVSGVSLMIKRKVIEKIGLLDPAYFAYWEDVDWCYRARKAGFRVVYVPKAIVEHHVSASWRKLPFKSKFLYERNRIRFIIKNYSMHQIFEWMLTESLSVYARVKAGFSRIKKGPWIEEIATSERELEFKARGILEWGLALICAYLWNFLSLPRTVKARLAI